MATTYKYKIYCQTETAWKYVWKESTEAPPDKCPDNTGHTVDTGGVAIIESVANDVTNVSILQNCYTTPGAADTTSIGASIVVTQSDSTSEITMSFPYSVDLVCGSLNKNPYGQYGDYVDAFVRVVDDGAIGLTTEAANSGQNKVIVDANVFGSLKPGYYIKFTTHVTEYRVDSMDSDTNELTLEDNLTSSVASDVGVHLRVKSLARTYVPQDASRILFCNEVMEVKEMSPSMELVIRYVHSGSGATDGYTLYGAVVYRY